MSGAPPRVLVVDDEPGIRRVLTLMLQKEGFEVVEASGKSALESHLETRSFDLLITDMRMPDISGLEVMRLVRESNPEARMLVMTAYPSADTTIQAIQKGAVDYITKEGDYLDKIRDFVRASLKRSLSVKTTPSRLEVRSAVRTEHIIGENPAMLEIFKIVGRVAERKSTVLISGESGTGKELIARAIHYHSPRRERPLISINCGALTETLLESELFGHVKGSFTGALADKKGLFEAADGGTLFLDEIGETSKSVQVKLLRVLQEEKVRRVGDTRDLDVDVRIIAATNQDLQALIREGTFREDLYFRLNVIPVHVPPLRERKEDIPELVKYFLDKYCADAGSKRFGLAPDAMKALTGYRWPGNVRELENVIERMIALFPGETVAESDLPAFVRSGPPSLEMPGEDVPDIPEAGIKLEEVVDAFEKRIILKALQETGGRRPEAARLLGLSARSFRYRIEKHGL